MTRLAELEAIIGGIYIALAAALTPERRDFANDLLFSFAGDARLSDYERNLYRDIVESVAMATAPGPEQLFDDLATATVH